MQPSAVDKAALLYVCKQESLHVVADTQSGQLNKHASVYTNTQQNKADQQQMAQAHRGSWGHATHLSDSLHREAAVQQPAAHAVKQSTGTRHSIH